MFPCLSLLRLGDRECEIQPVSVVGSKSIMCGYSGCCFLPAVGPGTPSNLLPAESVWHCRARTEPVPVGRGFPSEDVV